MTAARSGPDVSERAGFFDEFERLARLDSRYRAERVACRVLGVLMRHLPPAHAAALERYLPRRVAVAVHRSGLPDGRAPDSIELLQEVAVSAETSDPADAEAYLCAVLVALSDLLPLVLMDAIRAELPTASLLFDRRAGSRCLLCSPLPWPDEAGQRR